jgi:hypothetical protein
MSHTRRSTSEPCGERRKASGRAICPIRAVVSEVLGGAHSFRFSHDLGNLLNRCWQTSQKRTSGPEPIGELPVTRPELVPTAHSNRCDSLDNGQRLIGPR